MRIKDISKRSFMLVLVAWITFVSVFHAYETTTECAEWVAGTIATIGAGPMLTALLVGGVVVAGGIAVYKIATTDADDYRSFASGIKQGFQEFVSEQEKQIALEQNSSLSDKEAADIGIAVARDTVNNFFSNAITTTKNKVENITFSAWKYWDLFSRIIGNLADNGLPTISVNLQPNVYNLTDLQIDVKPKVCVAENTVIYNDKAYVQKGDFYFLGEKKNFDVAQYDTNDRVNFVYSYINIVDRYILYGLKRVNVNRLTGEVVSIATLNSLAVSTVGTIDDFNTVISSSSVPFICVPEGKDGSQNVRADLTVISLSASAGNVKNYENTVNSTLNNTKIGEAIQTGRRQLVNNGDWVGSIFKVDSVPVNKFGLRESEGVMTGQIGWQIPQTWDDYFGGSIPFPDVVGGTGSIGVSYPDVIPGILPDSKTVDFPADTDVQDTADYPRNPADEGEGTGEKPQEIPEKPAQDVFETQGGSYYPSAMDLTNIFPFCIPFDLIYLVEKFDIHGENAPVITIPIMYPQVMANSIGTDRYEVVIDFADFLVLRNIVRVFLLLGFIIGLLKMTRELIRG